MTDWKPGQVGLSRGSERFIVTSGGKCFWPGSSDALWSGISGSPVSGDRPLAVIDPESAEDIDRLCDLIAEDVDWLALQAALREFAASTPPKPDEPTGLGAVVIDAGGDAWVHDREANPGYLGVEWLNVRTQAHRHYRSIDVVRVLSEGVTP